MPNRIQFELRACEVVALLPEGHRAGFVWAYTMRANLDRVYAGIKAVTIAMALRWTFLPLGL